MGKNEASMDYTDQVFLLRTQGRSFNWELPHRPIQTSSQSKGTAFYMKYKNKIHLITCFHCIDDSFYTTVSSPSMGSEEYRCRVKWICPELDLACLEIDPTEKSKANNNILHPKKFLHPWTFRAEAQYVGKQFKTFAEEQAYFFFCLGVAGLFTEFPDQTRQVIQGVKECPSIASTL